ncbi:hypothetical protein ACFYZB_39740 [Streptomyces sp. NPDC001852]|uniref:hypothetical protein n=1 Tax=Streptomyces sp. NPDC001852 TaxID=3364619 RepID=UPI0036A16D4B
MPAPAAPQNHPFVHQLLRRAHAFLTAVDNGQAPPLAALLTRAVDHMSAEDCGNLDVPALAQGVTEAAVEVLACTRTTSCLQALDWLLLPARMGLLAVAVRRTTPDPDNTAPPVPDVPARGGARRQLGPDLPAIAAAWFASIEAVAHATAGDERATERALRSCEQHTARVPREDPPPWPWVFSFDERKVASCRVVCGARLGRSRWTLTSSEVAAVLSSGHEKQRALLTLDVATGHFRTGRIDSAFALATRAVHDGMRLRSGRVVERARAFRRTYTSLTPPGIVRDFDTLLHDTYL